MHPRAAHAAVLSHLIQPNLPYLTWPGQDTLLNCQFHSLFEIKKKTYIHTYTHSFSFNFLLVWAWSGPYCPCHACPGDGE